MTIEVNIKWLWNEEKETYGRISVSQCEEMLKKGLIRLVESERQQWYRTVKNGKELNHAHHERFKTNK